MNKQFSVNERVKELRTALKLSQQDFASGLGITQTTVWKIETNQSQMRDSTIHLICTTFNVRKDWLIEGVGEMFNPDPGTEPQSISGHWKEEAYSTLKAENSYLKQKVDQLLGLLDRVTAGQLGKLKDLSLPAALFNLKGSVEGSKRAA